MYVKYIYIISDITHVIKGNLQYKESACHDHIILDNAINKNYYMLFL